MDDSRPITSELREYATVSWNPWPEARDRLYQMCDAIDAVHANLERENGRLKRGVADLKGLLEDAERKGWARGYDEGFASADDALGVLEENGVLEEHGWVRLPKDADGECIRVGDVMEHTNGVFTVTDMTMSIDEVWRAWDGENGHTVLLAKCRHHHAPTVEDMLREFARDWLDAGVIGVKTNAERNEARAKVIAEYAAKLRLAGEVA